VVDDAMRMVAVVGVELSRLPRVRSRTRSHGRSRCRDDGGAKGKPPRTKTGTRRGSRRGLMPKSMQSGAVRRGILGFARPKNISGMMARTGVANTRHAREGAPPGVSSEGSAEKASTTVTSTQWRGEDVDAAHGCRSRRDDDIGHEVVLDEAKRCTPDDLAQCLMIRMTRRRSSKKMAKELKQLDEEHVRASVHICSR
jgi:hypothetical protein